MTNQTQQEQSPVSVLNKLLTTYTERAADFKKKVEEIGESVKKTQEYNSLSWEDIKSRERIFMVMMDVSTNLNSISQVLGDLIRFREELRQFLALLKQDSMSLKIGTSIVASTKAKAIEQQDRVAACIEELNERKQGLKVLGEAFKNLSYILTSNNLDGI